MGASYRVYVGGQEHKFFSLDGARVFAAAHGAPVWLVNEFGFGHKVA